MGVGAKGMHSLFHSPVGVLHHHPAPTTLGFHLHPLSMKRCTRVATKAIWPFYAMLWSKTRVHGFNLPSGRFSFVQCQTYNCIRYALNEDIPCWV